MGVWVPAPWPGVYGHCRVRSAWPPAEQGWTGAECMEDLLISLHSVILSLKLLRIKLYFHNKSDYDG